MDKLIVSYKRADGIRGWNVECNVKRFKDLWNHFRKNWVWCNVMKIDYRGKVVGEWFWNVNDGWLNVNQI